MTTNPSNAGHGFTSLLYPWIRKHYKALILTTFLAACVGAFYSVKLYQNLRTDMEELLPESAPSVKDLKAVGNRVGGLNHLSIVVESADSAASLKFVQDMEAELRKLPSNLVARVETNISSTRKFFDENRALYIDLADWESMDRYVKERIRYEQRAKKRMFSLGLDDEEKRPEYDFNALKKKYEDRSKEVDRFKDGYFVSQDGRTRVMLAFLPGKVTDIKSNQRLSEIAHEITAKLDPKKYAPDMVVGFDGDVQNLVEEHEGLLEDLISSGVLVLVLVAVSMLLFFRSFGGVFALCAALGCGTLITFGLSYLLVGYLNANTAFLGSIVIGNGINFGIIMLARYLEERRSGVDWETALPSAMRFTTQATWTAALAAGSSYASLMLTDFRGFNQFGFIGGMGMVLCWLASFTLMPALLIFFETRGWIRIHPGQNRESKPFSFLARNVVRFSKPIVIVSVASVFLSGLLVLRLSGDTIESDFSKLRNKRAMLYGSGFWGKKVDGVFGRYLTPTLVLTNSSRESEQVADSLRVIMKREGQESAIKDVKRVEDFLPTEQARKIRVIKDVSRQLSPEVLKRLSVDDRKLVDELLPKKELQPLTVGDLPEGVVVHFREMNGKIGNMVHVYPRLQLDGVWDAREVIRFAELVRQGVRDSGIGAFIAGQPPISSDMITAISKDGPKATLFAFLAVAFLVVLLFPRWSHSRSVLGTLFLGVLWMAAVMGAFKLKINFLNFIALPITFGIGVDYGVNIFGRYRSDGGRSIVKAIQSTGGAVALCSLTTIIGYGSLLIAGSQAFVSFGTLAILGEFTSLAAALITLPAAWQLFSKKKEDVEEEEIFVPTKPSPRPPHNEANL